MGWRSEWWEAKKRRSNAQHYISVRHDASAAHLERILNEHGGEDGGRAVREHPVAVDRRGMLLGETTLWRSSDLFGAAPTYEWLVYAEMIPLVIFDLVVAERSGSHLFSGRTNVGYPFELINLHVQETAHAAANRAELREADGGSGEVTR